jgi:hypothetical protein
VAAVVGERAVVGVQVQGFEELAVSCGVAKRISVGIGGGEGKSLGETLVQADLQ